MSTTNIINMLSTKPLSAYNTTFSFAYWDNLFSEEELLNLEAYLSSYTLEKAKTYAPNEVSFEARDNSIALIPFTEENFWISNKLCQITEVINTQFYNYDLLGFDYMQYTVYDKPGNHYAYHTDMFFDEGPEVPLHVPRKLSFSLILSDSKEYTGGDLEITTTGGTGASIKPEQKRGRIIAFPSFITHRVTPVTSGIRKSLVFWAVGPKFR